MSRRFTCGPESHGYESQYALEDADDEDGGDVHSDGWHLGTL
jgi:hypothetical protein